MCQGLPQIILLNDTNLNWANIKVKLNEEHKMIQNLKKKKKKKKKKKQYWNI